MKQHFYDLTIESLKSLLMNNGFKSYSGDQIFKWVYEQNVTNPELMTNISKALRDFLVENIVFDYMNVVNKQVAQDGTEKYLFKLHDGHVIETVLMNYDYGQSVCVTSQVGCSMGCSFCASGIITKKRDLSVAELVNQVASIQHHSKVKVTHIVVMGTGEPFDNYDNVMDFIRIINYKHGFQIGARHITVSTCGIVPRIYDYAKEVIKSNLAISLHAPNNEIRSRLMKINKVFSINELIKAVKDYVDMTNRRVTFEYILLKGVNDDISHANELSDLIRGINAYVNLIPYNPVDDFDYKKTDQIRAQKFYQQLEKRGINATLRRELGSDIDAACGQLRLKKERESLQ
ncbi:23S rRNA (adenine(2503)-C(2))-methyltransferase RlmN [Hujiaoplasma nucleasis]|uniref:Probable dual-specificity RNA methyltransferase RlmN n=1 Tax=Hujiaoplasma nucleasis TaxID=2725268 RepID=A0A7L6N2T5_9MOLU|nr:23S rRNA (adenine(2503)-C(2))-methyltransferase RlmN [Hujiaoplasma nucleasis]QLY39365.1 23S rRNA (adenine(2503)-C(2))-methyltransferase RlmN [Hujiaoplasma nucleasis]